MQCVIWLIFVQGKEPHVKQLESDISFHIGKQEAELSLKVNSAAYHGDLYQLKGLIRAGADPNKTDYDGRSPLVRTHHEFLRIYVCVDMYKYRFNILSYMNSFRTDN